MSFLAPSKERSTPLYIQIANNLRTKIADGNIDIGEALPSEREISVLTGASRVTVRKAIESLVTEGLLYRRQGSGTFVAPRIEAPSSFLSSFTDDALARGDKPSVVWIIKAYAHPTKEEAEQLNIPTSADVARLGRVRYANDQPLAIENAVVPKRFLPDLSVIKDSLYDALAGRGCRPVTGRQRVRASLATPTEAGLLQTEEDSEILRIERTTFTADGSTVEFTRSAYRGDRYEFVSDLT
ncbi:MAG: GntR family transcriptional regulator [Pseudomonadota bacterium]